MTTTDIDTAHDITRPLRLAVGSHSAGSGKGCAMNLISWENGDTTITDLPDCADPMLAKGNAFMAVGALHLLGDQGLVELLKKKGYKATPVM